MRSRSFTLNIFRRVTAGMSHKWALLAVLCVGTARACPSTCYSMTCDDWTEKSCAELEGWGCDCADCDCSSAGGGGADDKSWSDDKDASWAPAPTMAFTGAWTDESLEHEGVTRAYRLYVPAGAAATGLMIFLHGLGGSDAVRHAYEVATSADRYGFVGVVPTGSPMAANESAFEWNIDDAAGTNEVEFVHAVVRAVRAARPSLADAPTIALGFSNGAGLAALLGCHDSTGLWVAHVAVHYADSSDFPSTCEAASTPDAEWSAVGDLDYFIKNLTPDPVAGVLAQFEQSRDELDCAAEAATQTEGDGCTCYEYASCGALGQLCVYSDTGHEIRPSMTPLAWCYLTGAACDDSLSVNSAEAGRPLVLVTAAATALLAWVVGRLF